MPADCSSINSAAQRSNSINFNLQKSSGQIDLTLSYQMRQHSQKENSSFQSNLQRPNDCSSRNSCPNSKSSLISVGSISNDRNSVLSGDSCAQNSSRSSSNNYQGDRFIPFRGTKENFMEEFIINNDHPISQAKKPLKKSS